VIRTLIAESVGLVRVGLFAVLNREPDIKVVAELDRPEFVVPTALRLQPDVAVVDGAMAANDGLATIRELHAAVPACGLIIMTSSNNPGELREAIAARADGFVAKDSDPDKITEAIRRVAAGKKALDPDLAFSTFNILASPLTQREVDVLRLAAQGEPAMEIAEQLYLSVGTVRNYMSRAIGKTGARNRIDAIRIAEGAGWLLASFRSGTCRHRVLRWTEYQRGHNGWLNEPWLPAAVRRASQSNTIQRPSREHLTCKSRGCQQA
jgi:two-component system, NarL family, response regulator DesR